MKKLIKTIDLRTVLTQYHQEKITFSKMVEILNEKANGRLLEKESQSEELIKKLLKLLSEIDTASDAYKPSKRNGIDSYRLFYEFTMRKINEIPDILETAYLNKDQLELHNILKSKEGES